MLFRHPAARLAHGDLIEVGGRPVRLAVNARARRVGLRLDAARQQVVATAPSQRRLGEAVAFARQRSAWIAEHLDRLPAPCSLQPGASIEVLGQACRLERAAMRVTPRMFPATAEEPMRLLASGDDDAYARAAERALRAAALESLVERTVAHCSRLGVSRPEVSLTDARGRWGSCRQPLGDQPAKVRYSWRLVLSPAWVLDYVAAHECAHLIQANHSPAFWTVVRELYGEPRAARAWLRQNGARLHGIGRA